MMEYDHHLHQPTKVDPPNTPIPVDIVIPVLGLKYLIESPVILHLYQEVEHISTLSESSQTLKNILENC